MYGGCLLCPLYPLLSLIYITLPICVGVRVRVIEDAQNNRVLGMGMPRTRGCPYHCDTGITRPFEGLGTTP